MVQNFRIALIIIGFIIGSFEDFDSLEKAVKKDSNGFRLLCAENQRENKLESKNAAFYSFS